VCGTAFLIINFYRYTPNWGDSNKFVFFLNLGLSLIIAKGISCSGAAARPLLVFFLALTIVPSLWDFHTKIFHDSARTHLLFHPNHKIASRWLDTHLPPNCRLVTAEATDTHFVTSLTGRAVLAGIYSNTNPYVSERLRMSIQDVYENANLDALNDLDVDYLFISSHERSRYRLHSYWSKQMGRPDVIAFSIGRAEDHQSVFIIDVKQLTPIIQ
jgi:hypothetical protein